MPNAVIAGTAFHVPSRVVTNHELTQVYDTSDEWIFERSGIRERRWIDLANPQGPSDLALPAVHEALARAGKTVHDIELIVFATLSPEAWFPGSGCFLQDLLGIPGVPALDIRQQCSGFIYALSIAEQYLKRGVYKTVVVVGAEVQSTSLDPSNDGRTVGVLFGDGAGVVVLTAEDGPLTETGTHSRGIIATHMHADGSRAKELWVPEPSSKQFPKVSPDLKGLFPYMNGREVFKQAVTKMIETGNEALATAGWDSSEVDLFVLHQANYRIVQAVAEFWGMPMDKFFSNIIRYGNTTAASIPICLAEAEREGRLKPGDKVLCLAFGAGFTWGSAAIVW